jgi:hypothetical protein
MMVWLQLPTSVKARSYARGWAVVALAVAILVRLVAS